MPTDNISTSVISQTESLLTPLTSKNSEPVGSSFEQTLANEVQNNDRSGFTSLDQSAAKLRWTVSLVMPPI